MFYIMCYKLLLSHDDVSRAVASGNLVQNKKMTTFSEWLSFFIYNGKRYSISFSNASNKTRNN